MIHAHIFEYIRDAYYYAYRFAAEHCNEIEKIKKTSIFIVILKNGDEHHFLGCAVYDKWCRGRTYMIGDTLYRSEFPFKNDWKN